ncbi:MAG: hypothetical protein E1N59_1460 [Puniceicoccaceae bacterium 5H]|nr:MAG: hypothetical protein E1N59_1460 [Puniceicoccaceae bacterium 5H]
MEGPILLPYPAALAVYALLAISGLFDCFFGFKIFRATLSMLLALVGALAGGLLALHWAPDNMSATIVGAVAGLILGGLLAFQMLRAAVALSVAFVVGLLTASLMQQEAEWLRLLSTAGAALVSGGVAALLVQPALMLLTAFTGAFRFVFGTWFILGGPDVLGIVEPVTPAWGDLGRYGLALSAFLVLGLLGWWFQQFQHRSHQE